LLFSKIESHLIGEIVSQQLKKIDEVAYLRFMSVYKSFSSAKSFANEAEKLVSDKLKN
jgi:transcriptional repressor NrdR